MVNIRILYYAYFVVSIETLNDGMYKLFNGVLKINFSSWLN
jgi:hypothetical protein